ncbi:hypothetical protein McanMca71_005459 [Microsporum canis]
MSASELEAIRQELENEKRLRQQAEQDRERAERDREQAQQDREKAEQDRERAERDREQAQQDKEEAEQGRKIAERRIQQTTLPEFLNACHTHLSVGFSSRINYTSGTQGQAENASSKLRPNHILEWETFPQEQCAVWEDLLNVNFTSEPHFMSLNTLEELGKDIKRRLMGSELDLCIYERYTVEDRVSLIIRSLYLNHDLRDTFNILGEVIFENHGNTIGAEGQSDGPEPSTPQQSPVQKRRKQIDVQGDTLPAMPAVRSRSSRPRADQFCVYNAGREGNIPAFIIEYKAPHKLTLDTVDAGLKDMEVDDVVLYNEDDGPEKLARRRVAAVISQAFSYMIQGELEFGYICTGETFIFLRVPSDDPTTVYYYLSIPNKDVEEATLLNGSLDDCLHLTAVGQVLAFTLRALKTRPRGQDWRKYAEDQLKTWEIEHDDILFASDISEVEKSSGKKLSDYKQSRRSRDEYIRASPVRTRSKALFSASCRDPEERPTNSDPDSDDSNGGGGGGRFYPSSPTEGLPRRSSNLMVVVPPPPPPSSPPPAPTERAKYLYNYGPIAPWCTQKCLLGLRNRGPLDPDCPNVASHGKGQHAIDEHVFRKLVREQIIGKTGPWGCESMHRHGTSGALFWLTTFPYGYTLVAKAMPVEMVSRALHEERIYQHLSTIQGIYVPVCLGSVDISPSPLWYDGICEVVHLLLLGHAGRLVTLHAGSSNLKNFIPSVSESLRAIHGQGVLHRDAHQGNMFWNTENKRVILIDFERAKILDKEISMKSPSKKRKRSGLLLLPAVANKKHGMELFKRELRSVTSGMA